jgi:hypothetical protein
VKERHLGGDDEDKGRKNGTHVVGLRQRERDTHTKEGDTLCLCAIF